MPVCDQAHSLAAQGRIPDAYALLTAASDRGDASATALLANWRLSGALIRRDLSLARDLFGKAATQGNEAIADIHLALLANGAGDSGRRWGEAVDGLARRARVSAEAGDQLTLLRHMALDEAGDPVEAPQARRISEAPWVATIDAFLTPDECAFLMRLAQPFLQPSVVVHPQTGALIHDPVRTSSVAAFPFVLENPALHAINRRIAAATATTYEQGEPVQVLRYVPGQQYKMHSDALPGEGNQRATTLLVYLNDDYEGGETQFPDAALTFRGKAGDALMFRNILPDGTPDPRARHAGLPVRSGAKFLLSKWIRKAPLDLSGPPGRPF